MTHKTTEESAATFSTSQIRIHAGTHFLVELWQGTGWNVIAKAEQVLREAVAACGAALLELRVRCCTPYTGLSGVAIVQGSHVGVHTWPEYTYAAVDLFLCGDRADADPAVDMVVTRRELADASRLRD
jgi:S-adenosylmethionine decarboxylase